VDADAGIPHAHAQAREGEFIPGAPVPKRGRKRAKHVKTPESQKLVENLSGIGVPEREIAKLLTMRCESMRELYRDELDAGRAKAIAEVAKVAFTEAKKGGAAMMFWLRCRAGWSEGPQHVELTGKDGQPLQPQGAVLMVPMPLTEAEWEKQVSARQAALLDQRQDGDG
jgi:hypothetical protein